MDALFNDFWSMASQWISPLEPYHGSDVTASLGGTTDDPVMSKTMYAILQLQNAPVFMTYAMQLIAFPHHEK